MCEALDAEFLMDTDPDQTRKPDGPDCNRHDSTLASKYALLETEYAMRIDPKDQKDDQKLVTSVKGSVARTLHSHQPMGNNG